MNRLLSLSKRVYHKNSLSLIITNITSYDLLKSCNKVSKQLIQSIKMSTEANKKTLIAVCQLTSTEDKEKNFRRAEGLIRNAAQIGCEVVFLPECFDMICETRQQTMDNTEPIDGPTVTKYRELAKEANVWLSFGRSSRKEEPFGRRKGI